ncbi:unnamed protein product [Clonostachys byssicola]|uniref:D-isomer specific 2-hydroxyacid dehydrogenase NAD-binding domain-containing protein n=1 Tax=Clonostachys byssicola TaxID=160290 RepID=A0A9N9U4T7_9HYPO|nr:unnamed protein product [Clonostachys byssicola]
MGPQPKILVIGSPEGLADESLWKSFQSQYRVRMYDFPTLDGFHTSLRNGECSDIVGIVRLGLNIPQGIEKVGQGWTQRGLPYFPDSLRLIVNFGHGYDEEDIQGLQKKGIQFFNTPGGDEATAAVGIYLVISVFRQLGRYEKMLRQGDFLPALRDSAKTAVDTLGRHIGIVGMGAIGKAVARHAAGLGMYIHSLDRPNLRAALSLQGDDAASLSLPPITLAQSLDELVGKVDCVVLACSYTPQTHHLLSKEVFARMKHGMRIVNIARGKCIDEDALCGALATGQVAAAGLDVHYNESVTLPSHAEQERLPRALPLVSFPPFYPFSN